ncbi:MAG: hypothetical protein AAGE52_22685 [Myxococcota bacterium]
MNKLVPLTLLLALGCGDDDGRIMLMDTGPGRDGGVADSGGGTDASGGVDAGGGGMCMQPTPDLAVLNMDPAAMGMLLPRCAPATRTTLQACTNVDCLVGALNGDTTPGVDIGGGQIINCNACFNIQFNRCLDERCGTQFAAFRCCAEANGCADINNCPACSTENDALTSCAMTAGVTIPSCTAFTDPCFDG